MRIVGRGGTKERLTIAPKLGKERNKGMRGVINSAKKQYLNRQEAPRGQRTVVVEMLASHDIAPLERQEVLVREKCFETHLEG